MLLVKSAASCAAAQRRPVHRHRHRRPGGNRKAGIEAAVRRIRQMRYRRRSRRRGVDRIERQRAGARGVARRVRQRRRDRDRLGAGERIALGRIGVDPARRALGEVRRQLRAAQRRPVHRHRHRRPGVHREAGIEAAVRRIRQMRIPSAPPAPWCRA